MCWFFKKKTASKPITGLGLVKAKVEEMCRFYTEKSLYVSYDGYTYIKSGYVKLSATVQLGAISFVVDAKFICGDLPIDAAVKIAIDHRDNQISRVKYGIEQIQKAVREIVNKNKTAYPELDCEWTSTTKLNVTQSSQFGPIK